MLPDTLRIRSHATCKTPRWGIRLGWLMASSIAVAMMSCKPPKSKSASLSSAADDNDATAVVAVVNQIDDFGRALFESLSRGQRIHDYTLRMAVQKMNLKISDEVGLTHSTNSQIIGPDAYPQEMPDIYRGVLMNSRVFVFAKEHGAGAAEKYWKPITWFASSVLENNASTMTVSLEKKIRHVLDAKIYEPKRISDFEANVGAVDLLAHFIPGYAGAGRIFVTGKSEWDSFMGTLEVAGDIATLGLGSKVRIVKTGASAIVLTVSSARVSEAALKAGKGQGTWATGVNAFLATAEGALAAVTLVKVHVTPLKGLIKSRQEAEALGRQLNRSADDLLANGIPRQELERMGIKVSKFADAVAHGMNPQRIINSFNKIAQGEALSADEALEIVAAGLNKSSGKLFFNVQRDIDIIAESERFRATRGRVFATEVPISTSRLRTHLIQGEPGTRKYTVIFQGQAAKHFIPHEIRGADSLMKRMVLGEFHTDSWGDLLITKYKKEGDFLIVTEARPARATDIGGRFAGGKTVADQVREQRIRASIEVATGRAGVATLVIGTGTLVGLWVKD